MPTTVDALLLIGWMERDDAIAYLKAHCCFDEPMTDAQAEALWRPYRDAVDALPERTVEPLTRMPIPQSDKRHVENFKARFKGDPEIIDVVNIDVSKLVVYQFYVVVDRSNEHASNSGRWCQKTLVIDRPAAQLPARMEENTIKFTLPHAEHVFGFQPDGSFRIQQFAGFVSVAEVGNRPFLKAGYHRSFAFSRAALNAPDANDRLMLAALTRSLPPQLAANVPNPGLRTMVLGPRPPLFSDFFDPVFAMPVKLRKKRWEAHLSIVVVDEP